MTALPAQYYPDGPQTPAEHALEAALTDEKSPAWLLKALAVGATDDPAQVAEYFRGAAGIFERLAAERYGAVAEAIGAAGTRH